MSTLHVAGVEYSYPDGHKALDGVDLAITERERVALLGPNGAGKTTLALHLNGILSPSSGTVHIGELPVLEPQLMEVRRRVGLVFQDPNDQLFMPTVRDDVAFGPANLGFGGPELDARVEAALSSVGAEGFGDRAPHHLSGGERRRVAIATVLAMEPDILVLDEPTAGLDPAGRREVTDLLMSLPMTLLVITHDLPLALELCDRSVIMDTGRVEADGPTSLLLSDEALLRQHRLELPYGFDPGLLSA